MKNVLKLPLLFFVLLFSSCLKDITVPGSDAPPKPIAGFVLRTGEYPRASFSFSNVKTSTPGDIKYYYALRQAEVQLFKNGSYLTALKFDTLSSFHVDSTVTIESGATYSFTVDFPSLNLSASGPAITVPAGITPQQVSFTNTSGMRRVELNVPKDPANPYVLLHFSFYTEDTASSYYPVNEMGLEAFSSDADWLGISGPNPADYNFSDVELFYYKEKAGIALNDSSYISYQPAAFAFDATKAPGSEANINIRFKTFPNENLASQKKLRIQTVTVNRDYYEYVISAQKYMATSGNPFASPVQVYSNIINGHGIFGAAHKTEILINL